MALFKTTEKKNNNQSNFSKIPIKFDISMMNMFIGYIFKKSVQVTRKSLNNMKRLFDIIDENIYSGNDQMEARFEFIKKALEAKIDKGFENDDIIINYCRSDVTNKYNEEIINSIPEYAKINYEEMS